MGSGVIRRIPNMNPMRPSRSTPTPLRGPNEHPICRIGCAAKRLSCTLVRASSSSSPLLASVCRAGVVANLGCVDDFVHPAFDRQRGFGFENNGELRMGLGCAGHEQRTAIGSILRRYLEGAKPFGFCDDFQFVGGRSAGETRVAPPRHRCSEYYQGSARQPAPDSRR